MLGPWYNFDPGAADAASFYADAASFYADAASFYAAVAVSFGVALPVGEPSFVSALAAASSIPAVAAASQSVDVGPMKS